jgi:hypothetical protein
MELIGLEGAEAMDELKPDRGLEVCTFATWKRHVTLKMRDGCDVHYLPSTWARLLGKKLLRALRRQTGGFCDK